MDNGRCSGGIVCALIRSLVCRREGRKYRIVLWHGPEVPIANDGEMARFVIGRIGLSLVHESVRKRLTRQLVPRTLSRYFDLFPCTT